MFVSQSSNSNLFSVTLWSSVICSSQNIMWLIILQLSCQMGTEAASITLDVWHANQIRCWFSKRPGISSWWGDDILSYGFMGGGGVSLLVFFVIDYLYWGSSWRQWTEEAASLLICETTVKYLLLFWMQQAMLCCSGIHYLSVSVLSSTWTVVL